MTPGPNLSALLTSSFRDALAVAKTNLWPCIAFLLLGTICAAVAVGSGTMDQWLNPKAPPSMPIAFAATLILFYLSYFVIWFFAIAASVRTVRPEYRMTVGRFFGFIGYSIVIGILTMLAMFCFIIPGFWVGYKLLLTPYTYALNNGESDPIGLTWRMTDGYYWQTLGMALLIGFIVGIPMQGIMMLVMTAATASTTSGAPIPPAEMLATAIIFTPLVLAFFVWLLHVQMIMYVRWTDGLMNRARGVPSELTPIPT